MSTPQHEPAHKLDVSAMRVVTISREYGSGGGEIAARLARRLGWQLIDHDVVVRIAAELGVTEAEVEEHDERADSLVTRILSSMQAIEPSLLVDSPEAPPMTPEAYADALRHLAEGAVASGHVVIVGRGAQVLLAGRRDTLHARIVAPPDQRVRYVALREGLDEPAARARIQLKDRDRARYLQTQHHVSPADPLLYDVVVNTGMLDLDAAVDLIALALEHKAHLLRVPMEQLGPATGLTRYPGAVEDLRPSGGAAAADGQAGGAPPSGESDQRDQRA